MKLKFWSISERIYYRWKQRSLLGSIFPSFIVSDSLIRKKCRRANPLVPSSGSTLTTCTRTGSAPFPQEEQPPGSSFRWWSTGTKLGNNLWPRLDQLQQRFAAKAMSESNFKTCIGWVSSNFLLNYFLSNNATCLWKTLSTVFVSNHHNLISSICSKLQVLPFHFSEVDKSMMTSMRIKYKRCKENISTPFMYIVQSNNRCPSGFLQSRIDVFLM